MGALRQHSLSRPLLSPATHRPLFSSDPTRILRQRKKHTYHLHGESHDRLDGTRRLLLVGQVTLEESLVEVERVLTRLGLASHLNERYIWMIGMAGRQRRWENMANTTAAGLRGGGGRQRNHALQKNIGYKEGYYLRKGIIYTQTQHDISG
jgi:hypothetical protein